MIRVVFFDVDGTLLSHTGGAVPLGTRAALDALHRAGVLRVLATGRHLSELADLPMGGLTFDGAVTVNGQLCLDQDGSVFYDHPISGADREVLLELFREKALPLLLVERERTYVNFVNERVRLAQAAISSPLPETAPYTGGPVYQVIAYADPAEEAMLRQRLPGCRLTRWNPWGVDILSADGGKVAGIQAFLRRYGIHRSETMAFGDGDNDAEMLAFAGIGVAMGNGRESAKRAADYVTASVDEEGVARALAHFGLL